MHLSNLVKIPHSQRFVSHNVNNLVYNIKLEDIKTLKKHIEEYFINISKHNKLDIMKALEYIKDKDSKKNVCVQIMIHFIDNVREERF